MTTTKALSEADLKQFTGSENCYRHPLNRDVVFTDGAKYVADEGGAYWLLDIISLAQRYDKRVAAEEFQSWRLTVWPDRTATLVCEDGSYSLLELGGLLEQRGDLDLLAVLCRPAAAPRPV